MPSCGKPSLHRRKQHVRRSQQPGGSTLPCSPSASSTCIHGRLESGTATGAEQERAEKLAAAGGGGGGVPT